jgi:DNA-binding transcriptional regulator YdaS (Cro superfamily)
MKKPMDVRQVFREAGGVTRLAREIGMHHSTLVRWKRVPAERVSLVSCATGIPDEELRPDLFCAPPRRGKSGADPSGTHGLVRKGRQ